MSPSEFELRAALHRGEGEPLDADAVIAQARATRRSRRTTIGAVAGSAVAVAAIATSAVVLTNGSSNGHGQQAAPAPGATQTQPTPVSPQTGSSPWTPPTQQSGGTVAACPSRPPHVMTPPGNQFGANEQLLPTDINKITVCVYQQDNSAAGFFSATGADAVKIAKTLNALPEPGNQPCTADLGPTVVLLPDHGREAVGNAGGCGLITNGTAKRVGRDALINLIGKAVLHTVPPGRMTHGPAPS